MLTIIVCFLIVGAVAYWRLEQGKIYFGSMFAMIGGAVGLILALVFSNTIIDREWALQAEEELKPWNGECYLKKIFLGSDEYVFALVDGNEPRQLEVPVQSVKISQNSEGNSTVRSFRLIPKNRYYWLWAVNSGDWKHEVKIPPNSVEEVAYPKPRIRMNI